MEIKNIIPALGWNAVYKLTESEQVARPLVCWAIKVVYTAGKEEGCAVVGMLADENNDIVPANTLEGFKGYDYDIDLLESEMFEMN